MHYLKKGDFSMEGFIKSLMMISLMTILASCGGGGGGGGSDDDVELSDEAKALSAASENLEASGTADGGLLIDEDRNNPLKFAKIFQESKFSMLKSVEFDPEEQCRVTGTYDSDDTSEEGWARC